MRRADPIPCYQAALPFELFKLPVELDTHHRCCDRTAPVLLTLHCCIQAVIPLEKLRDFIAFARTRCQPELSDEAGQDLVNAYQTMRNQGMGKNTISATPRQLESMIRLSEALARMRLSPTVERHDVAEAVRLMKVSMVQSEVAWCSMQILVIAGCVHACN